MLEKPQGLPDIDALVASIHEYHVRALRSEQQMHEWAIISREIISRSREILVEVDRALRRASVAGRVRVIRAGVLAKPRAPSLGSEEPRR